MTDLYNSPYDDDLEEMPSNGNNDPADWSQDDVCQWLEERGLGRLVDVFRQHLVDGETLLIADEDDLKEIGLTSNLQRKRLLKEIEKLKEKNVNSVLSDVPHNGTIAFRMLKCSEITLGERIGGGSFGEVYLATWRSSTVVVKRALEHFVNENQEKSVEEFIREATLMSQVCNHPNIVNFIGATVEFPNLYLVLEYEKLGSLDQVLIHQKRFMEPTHKALIIRMMIQAVAGLIHLHSEGVIHRDIATRNLLLDSALNVKVCDFGMSRNDSKDIDLNSTDDDGNSDPNQPRVSKTLTVVGPLKWEAPETISQRIYSVQSDVFMFGVCMWEMMAREEPYSHEGMNAQVAAAKVLDGKRLLRCPDNCDPRLYQLMQACWAHNPQQRPALDNCLQTLTQLHEELATDGLAALDLLDLSQSSVNNNEQDTYERPEDLDSISTAALLAQIDNSTRKLHLEDMNHQNHEKAHFAASLVNPASPVALGANVNTSNSTVTTSTPQAQKHAQIIRQSSVDDYDFDRDLFVTPSSGTTSPSSSSSDMKQNHMRSAGYQRHAPILRPSHEDHHVGRTQSKLIMKNWLASSMQKNNPQYKQRSVSGRGTGSSRDAHNHNENLSDSERTYQQIDDNKSHSNDMHIVTEPVEAETAPLRNAEAETLLRQLSGPGSMSHSHSSPGTHMTPVRTPTSITLDKFPAKAADSSLCLKCQSTIPTFMFQPCQHVACCDSCAQSMSDCPTCQQPVTKAEPIVLW